MWKYEDNPGKKKRREVPYDQKDQISKDAYDTRRKGMSYGQYMATKYKGPVKKPSRYVEPVCHVMRAEPEGVCLRCGNTYIRRSNVQKFCSRECRMAYNDSLKYSKGSIYGND